MVCCKMLTAMHQRLSQLKRQPLPDPSDDTSEPAALWQHVVTLASSSALVMLTRTVPLLLARLLAADGAMRLLETTFLM
jgi:hypothetical protein